MKLSLFASIAGATLLLAVPAFAVTTSTTVDSTAGPWDPTINSSLDYGQHNNSAPDAVSSPFSFAAGGQFTITYDSGTVSAGFNFPDTDAKGDTGFLANNSLGNSGNPFPSAYVPSSQYPAYLMELIGAFASSTGEVVGTPFVIGDNFTATAPSGATQLLLGFNDDIFPDNAGSITVDISGPSAVPEPASWAMLLVGLTGIGGLLRSRRKPQPAAAGL